MAPNPQTHQTSQPCGSVARERAQHSWPFLFRDWPHDSRPQLPSSDETERSHGYIRARARPMGACTSHCLHACATGYSSNTMNADYTYPDSPCSLSSSTTCYFSLPTSHIACSLAYFSVETPLTTPLSTYCPDTDSDPSHPLLAVRRLSLEAHMPASPEASKLLQLQTAAAHRPAAQPLQQSSSTSSNDSSSASASSMGSKSPAASTICCCRCRRECDSGMIQFATNLYYCSHCARMTGYCAG